MSKALSLDLRERALAAIAGGCRDGRPPLSWPGLRNTGMVAPSVIDGPVNREVFELYVEKPLVPEREPGDIVVMDNLSSHKGPAFRAIIQAAGARLL
jgi:hypothetical protein